MVRSRADGRDRELHLGVEALALAGLHDDLGRKGPIVLRAGSSSTKVLSIAPPIYFVPQIHPDEAYSVISTSSSPRSAYCVSDLNACLSASYLSLFFCSKLHIIYLVRLEDPNIYSCFYRGE